ncbi:MAG: adenylosuccinate lyase [Candidatus Omnitrophica bacterium]|nr:adenylosuccinate lyase [Candidatus Omnitrophota bacterium]
MIKRYSRKIMRDVWSEDNKLQKMLEVELAVCEVLSEKKIIPKKDFLTIKKKAKFNAVKIKELEKITRHDVAAFVNNVSSYVGAAGKYIHWGLTSTDVVDSGQAVQLRETVDILINDLKGLMRVLKKKAVKYKNTICVGRTHGIHAEPTTFGLKMALYYEEAKRNLKRLNDARDIINVGKISGSVGTFSHLGPEVQDKALKKLGLKAAAISTQVLQRDRHAQYISTLAIVGASLEKIALEVRNLQRTDVLEAEEYFSKGQKGSSSMPHKRNPVRSERVCGLARVLRGYVGVALDNVALWHERDISHSSAERIILPDAAMLLDYLLSEMTYIVDNLIVYPDKMIFNLEKVQGLIFSQRLMLYLIQEKGLTRKTAYDLIQKSALYAWEKKVPFKDVLLKDKKFLSYVGPKEIDKFFDYKYYLRYVDKIYKRVGI